jgi:hypothetical protein
MTTPITHSPVTLAQAQVQLPRVKAQRLLIAGSSAVGVVDISGLGIPSALAVFKTIAPIAVCIQGLTLGFLIP